LNIKTSNLVNGRATTACIGWTPLPVHAVPGETDNVNKINLNWDFFKLSFQVFFYKCPTANNAHQTFFRASPIIRSLTEQYRVGCFENFNFSSRNYFYDFLVWVFGPSATNITGNRDYELTLESSRRVYDTLFVQV
jgi:hypothetical protein